MPISKNNISQHELIGLDAAIIISTDISQKGMHGKIVNETRNMIFIEDVETAKIKKIQKKGTVFEFNINDKKITVKGDNINYRPEDRIKRNR